jgi:AcrR family transcriptional regulator
MARKSKIDVRKPEILEHFYQVVIEEGFEGASIAKIAAHMGVHPSLLIHYFKTKEEMLVELVDFILNRYEETFLPPIRSTDDPRERLDRLLDAVFSLRWHRTVDQRVYLACFYLSAGNDRIRKRLVAMYDRFREVIIEEIAFYQDRGIVEVDDPQKAADIMLSLVEGIGSYIMIMGDARYREELAAYLKGIALSVLGVSGSRGA